MDRDEAPAGGTQATMEVSPTRASAEELDAGQGYEPEPGIRLGLAPLYTRFVDVWAGIDRLRALLEHGS